MPAFYPVKAGGTATGDAGRVTVRPTGSFATLGVANYYDSIVAAMAATTAPTSNDEILPSDAHSKDYGASVATYTGPTTAGAPLNVISVSDSNMDQASEGAVELQGSGTSDFAISGQVTFWGITIGPPGDDIIISGTGSAVSFNKGALKLKSSSGSLIQISSDGMSLKLRDTDIDFASAASSILIQGGSYFEMIGGSLTSALGSVTNFISGGAQNGGMRAVLNGVGLSKASGTLLANVGGNISADDAINVSINDCDLNASVAFSNEAFESANQFLTVTRSSSVSAAKKHQTYKKTSTGEGEDTSSIFRDESEAYSGGTQTSIEIITTANASRLNPFVFSLGVFAELASASSDVIRVYLTSDTTLTDNDVWITLIYSDGTTENVPVYLSTENADPIAAGTELTADGVSTWTLGKTNKYLIDADTSGVPGADGAIFAMLNVGRASTTLYASTSIDQVA